MHHIEIETVWRFHKEGSPKTAVVMLGVLNEIRKTGKLTSAAKHAQLSYRHVWNLVEQWSEFFGVPLVETHRGKGTVLTAFGEKLVWAGERMVSLAQGACDLSGVHLPRGELRAQGIRACKEWLDPREDRVISFVTREMGLMVKRGNPLKIASLKDVVERKARFVNRDHDSGTRLLFDQLLALHRIDEAKINGAQQMEFTHAAVAAYVAQRILIADIAQIDADAGFAVEQFTQLGNRKTVAGVNPDDGRTLMQEGLDFGGEFLREIFKLRTTAAWRMSALASRRRPGSSGSISSGC